MGSRGGLKRDDSSRVVKVPLRNTDRCFPAATIFLRLSNTHQQMPASSSPTTSSMRRFTTGEAPRILPSPTRCDASRGRCSTRRRASNGPNRAKQRKRKWRLLPKIREQADGRRLHSPKRQNSISAYRSDSSSATAVNYRIRCNRKLQPKFITS